MKKTHLNLVFVLCFSLNILNCFAQTDTTRTIATNPYSGKTYIFTENHLITECYPGGKDVSPSNTPVALKGMRFYVTSDTTIDKKKYLVINFLIWGLRGVDSIKETLFQELLTNTIKRNEYIESQASKSSKGSWYTREMRVADTIDILLKRQKYNFKQYSYRAFVPLSISSPNDNKRYFKISEDDFKLYSAEYKKIKNWDISFGALTTPFKLRFNKFSFSNNLSIGTAVYFQRKFSTDWSWGGVAALSLSSVTLDAASTNIHPDSVSNKTIQLQTSTTRPAFTPSLHYVMTYKNINFTFGVGADFISKTKDRATAENPEAGWIYNGKPWIGIGFGVSLFNNTKATTPTPSDKGQDDK